MPVFIIVWELFGVVVFKAKVIKQEIFNGVNLILDGFLLRNSIYILILVFIDDILVKHLHGVLLHWSKHAMILAVVKGGIITDIEGVQQRFRMQ